MVGLSEGIFALLLARPTALHLRLRHVLERVELLLERVEALRRRLRVLLVARQAVRCGDESQHELEQHDRTP